MQFGTVGVLSELALAAYSVARSQSTQNPWIRVCQCFVLLLVFPFHFLDCHGRFLAALERTGIGICLARAEFAGGTVHGLCGCVSPRQRDDNRFPVSPSLSVKQSRSVQRDLAGWDRGPTIHAVNGIGVFQRTSVGIGFAGQTSNCVVVIVALFGLSGE